MRKILLISANPLSTSRIKVDKELSEIQASIQRSANRNEFSVIIRSAATIEDVRRALLDNQPEIVHFCCHGDDANGLMLENSEGGEFFAEPDALVELLWLFHEKIKCLIFNSCNSFDLAKSAAKTIDFSIGMKSTISDDAAICFSSAFYESIGAGNSVDFSYSIACNALKFNFSTEAETPLLFQRTNKNINEESMSVSFKEIEVRAALCILADFTGLNFVVSDSICGTISFSLRDVKWMRVLMEIEDRKGLISIFEGENIFVRPIEEAIAIFKLREARHEIAKHGNS